MEKHDPILGNYNEHDGKNLSQIPSENIIVTRELIPFNKKNLNDRIYKQENIVNLDSLMDKSNNKMLIGELGHPEHFDVSLTNVSHSVEKLWIENDTLMGTIKVLDTPRGKILGSMIDDVVFRPRSAGTVNEDGICEMVRIFSFDAIPKSEDAWANFPPAPPSDRQCF